MKQQLNFVVSVLPKSDSIIGQIDEAHELEKALGQFLHEKGYKFVIAGEDMMSETAKNKVRDVNIAEVIKVLESAKGSDFYTTEYQNAINLAIEALKSQNSSPAHWIFSGDEEDYDGYYINCSKCGAQRMAYDRHNELDIPMACPHCGAKIDPLDWEYAEPERNIEKSYSVSVIYNTGRVKRPYILDVRARNEEQTKTKALAAVVQMLNADQKMQTKLYVDCVVQKDED